MIKLRMDVKVKDQFRGLLKNLTLPYQTKSTWYNYIEDLSGGLSLWIKLIIFLKLKNWTSITKWIWQQEVHKIKGLLVQPMTITVTE